MSSVATSAVVGGRGSVAPGRLWREAWESLRHPDFWAVSSWLDIIVRARKSRLGLLWLMSKSLVYTFGLGTFFASMRQVGGGDASMGEFYAYVGVGMMAYSILMAAINGSSQVFVASRPFILDGHMRLTDYLLQVLAKAFFEMCMFVPTVAIALWMAGGIAPLGFLTTLPLLLLIYLNAFWIATLFGVLGARFPDMGNMVNTVMIFAFILTPIIWYPAMMPAGTIRGSLMRFNPLFHFVEVFRAPILDNTISYHSLLYVGIFTVCGLLVATFVYRRYARLVPLWI